MGELMVILAKLMHSVVVALQLLILVHVVMTWTAISIPLNAVTRFLYTVVETLYDPIRRLIPTALGGVDFTPMIALILLSLFDSAVVGSLLTSGYRRQPPPL